MIASVLRVLIFFGVATTLWGSERAPSARELIDEIKDSRVVLGKRYSEVSLALKAAVEGSDDGSRLEKELQALVQTVDDHLTAFGGMDLDGRSSSEALRQSFVEFLRWQREELPRGMRAALRVARGSDGPSRAKAVQEALAPVAEGEQNWLRRLDELGAQALNESSRAVSSPVPERKSILYHYGKQMVWLFGSFVVLGLVIWLIARKLQRASRRR